ncbi:MAG: TIGR04255 family protein [Anaerolineae bacterium]|nr:TIGR04255 family protein [Anaerolineae bacterium]MDW8067894.1 TIGR04255 family protein [Anaerolineae bacterium]
MGRKYQRPPVVEAVCQFVLSSDTPWDVTIPGLFYEKLIDEFPHRETRVFRGVGVRVPSEQEQPAFFLGAEPILVLSSESRTMLVQLGPRILTVNALKPYPTWAVFRSKIEKAWSNLRAVVEVEGLEFVGLRYINQINISEFPQRLEDCFEIRPRFGPLPASHILAFIVGGLISLNEGRDRCRVQLNNVLEDPTTVVLDIEYSLAQSKSLAPEWIIDWLEEAHSKIEEIFEGSITDHLRAMFEPEA